MDKGDNAQVYEEREREEMLSVQQKQPAKRYQPYRIDGEVLCPFCLEPLPVHRLDIGVCVPCLTEIEGRPGYAAR